MPTLHWIGKEKVTNHHLDIPYHTLDLQYSFANGVEAPSPLERAGGEANLIIHADNLLALKSLLPQYEGRIKCIYIDPPYNTGNEGWVYNDNVSSPRFKKWLGQVVGKEGEDLTRHDKWLCMMYPRLKLLHKLLADDGAIFISIDDNEQASLKMMMDEIFGAGNFKGKITRATGTPTGQGNTRLANEIDYLVVYSKSSSFEFAGLSFSDKDEKIYNLEDNKGRYLTRTLRKTGGEDKRIDRPNMYFGIKAPNGAEVFPIGPGGYESRWRIAQNTYFDLVEKNMIEWKQNSKGDLQPYMKFYLEGRTKQAGNLWNDVEGNKKAQIDLKAVFHDKVFETPKPIGFIERIIRLSCNKDSIILDSFAGSGTTAHAVLNLNKQDGGKRKFILIEMEDYAETITAERVKRVINGYGKHTPNPSQEGNNGTGGSFSFYTLGERVLDDEQNLNPNLALHKVHGYIWYSETHTAYTQQATAAGYLGKYNNSGIYFHYQPHQVTVLDDAYLTNVTELCEQYIMYADICLLPETLMHKHNIIFKKIPRDISKL